MELATVLRVIENAPKGANIVLEWLRPADTFKGTDKAIDKHVRMVGRVGLDYDNQASVQAKRESGELPEQSQPIWHGAGEWVTFPFLIRHKKTGQLYLRLYNGTSTRVPVNVQWLMDGDPVSYETVLPYLMASEKKTEKGDCFCCKIENILRIGNEADWLAEVEEVPAETPAETPAVSGSTVPATNPETVNA